MSKELRLTLVRHAKSSWRFAGLDDFHRPLNKRGLRDAVRMPRQIAQRVPAPELLLSSAAVRAVQTCQALADAFASTEAAVRIEPDLYLASAPDVLRVVARAAGDARHVLVVGHNPGLTELYNFLARMPVDNLPTLGTAHLELDARGWDRVGQRCALSTLTLTPKELLADE